MNGKRKTPQIFFKFLLVEIVIFDLYDISWNLLILMYLLLQKNVSAALIPS